MNKDAFNFLRQVLTEKIDEQPQAKNDIIKRIKDLDEDMKDESEPSSKAKPKDGKPEEDKKKSSVDAELVRIIEESIVDHSPNVKWDDI